MKTLTTSTNRWNYDSKIYLCLYKFEVSDINAYETERNDIRINGWRLSFKQRNNSGFYNIQLVIPLSSENVNIHHNNCIFLHVLTSYLGRTSNGTRLSTTVFKVDFYTDNHVLNIVYYCRNEIQQDKQIILWSSDVIVK